MFFAATAPIVAVTSQSQGVIRHLTYRFGITIQASSTEHTSGIGHAAPVTGTNERSDSQSDEGTITADVVGLRPDTGIVVRISEVRRVGSDVPAVDCVVWGVGTVVCEPGASTTDEERGLLRFLGRNFVSESLIDQHGRWKTGVRSKDGDDTATYQVHEPKAHPLHITFQRVVSQGGAQGFNATTDGSMVYDQALTVPISIDEDTVLRTSLIDGNVEQGAYQEIRTTLHLRQLADSLNHGNSQIRGAAVEH